MKDLIYKDYSERGVGRPPHKFSEAGLQQLEAVSRYLTAEYIAGHFGIPTSTFYNIINRQPEAKAALERGRASAAVEIGEIIMQMAREGNFNAAKFYMTTQGGWKETSRHEVMAEVREQPKEIVIRAVTADTVIEGELADDDGNGESSSEDS